MKNGTRVKTTRYGNGTVIDQERARGNIKPVSTGRVGVKLDNPELWSCSNLSNGTAYYFPSELIEITIDN
jgi:hypothetical protein